MPVDPNAAIAVTAFDWVPDFAKGHVRDLRVRWALEELGLDYRERLLNARAERPASYFEEHPFGQIPVLTEDGSCIFETGAILLHLGERSETLLPRDPAVRSRAISWLFAGLNSVEPYMMELARVDIFAKREEWSRLRRPSLVAEIEERLEKVSAALGDKDHLAGPFTIADIVMTTVLRQLDDTDVLGRFDALSAYLARCLARPAYARALDAHLAAFERPPASAA